MQWVEQRYTRPVVVVTSSPAANAACHHNSLDVVQLLRPFAVFQGNLQAKVGDRSEPHLTSNFAVRLMRPECVREVNNTELRRHTQEGMRRAAAVDLAYGEQLDRALTEIMDPRRGGPLASPARLPSPAVAATLLERSHPSWHTDFIEHYHHLVRCSSWDALDHPVGVLYAAASSEEGGVEGVLRAFRQQAQQALALRAGMPGMDSELHHYYLLIHDLTQSGGPTTAEARRILGAVQQIYGSNYCALVPINSVANPKGVKCLDPTPWVEANPTYLDVPSASALSAARGNVQPIAVLNGNSSGVPVAAPVQTCPTPDSQLLRYPPVKGICSRFDSGEVKVTGYHLSAEDVSAIKDVMDNYLGMSLFRFIERRRHALDVYVQDKRTTTLGKVAAWFKSKEDAKPRMEVDFPRDGGNPRYLFTSLEMQMRRCGDLSMALKDYEGAVSYYKMCLDELVETLPQRHFNRSMIAGCQEGIGVAYFFLEKCALPSTTPWYTGNTGSSSKLQQHCRLEIALNDYLAAGICTYALRTAFWLFEFCRTRKPPAVERGRAVLQHILRTRLTTNSRLYRGITTDLLATTYLYANPPYPASGPLARNLMSANELVVLKVRTYVRFLAEAGELYDSTGMIEMSLRCYLRLTELLRGLGERGCWVNLYENAFMTVSKLYFRLGQDVKGIIAASAAVAQGSPYFSNTETGLENFTVFWDQQRRILETMGYTLCPHMPIPCIARKSFRVVYHYYGSDTVTEREEKYLGKGAVETEWRLMEDHLRNHYQQGYLTQLPQYRYPHYHGDVMSYYLFSSGDSARASTTDTAGPQWPKPNDTQPSATKTNATSGAQRSYVIPHTEPLWLHFDMHNPVGGALTASNVCILYMSADDPEQLWKGSDTRTVTLEPNQTLSLDLPFDPSEPGEYILVGLCWSLLGQEGYYYFATVQDRPGCGESLYAYAIEHPTPTLNAPENVRVSVISPRAQITATLEPPPPVHLQDGEYFRTDIVLCNRSTTVDASHVCLQRSPGNAHIMWIGPFDLEHNLNVKAALPVADRLAAGESLRLPLTIRAQHNRGNSAVKCLNYLLFLVGYVPDAVSLGGADSSSLVSRREPSLTDAANATKGFGVNAIRLHRLLRSLEVRPAMAVYSTMLPPSGPTLQAAAAVTVKPIGSSKDPSVRVARVEAIHRREWRIECGPGLPRGDVLAQMPGGHALCFSLLVERLPRRAHDKRESPVKDEGGDFDAYAHSECFSLTHLVTAAAHRADVEQISGRRDDVDVAAQTQYFMRSASRGSGGVGEATVGTGEIAFYLDKAAQQRSESPESKRAAELAVERRTYGDILERYTPIAVSVAWVMVGDTPGSPLVRTGQLFHMLDPIAYMGSQQIVSAGLSEGCGSTASFEHQADLCHALVQNKSVSPHLCGFVYHVSAPPETTATLEMPTAVLAPLQLRCQSFAPVPLLVEVTADTPLGIQAKHSGRLPFTFVGKTRFTFWLHPSDFHEVRFKAHITVPGAVNCNAFTIVTTPLLYQPSVSLCTGMTRSEVIAALRSAAAADMETTLNMTFAHSTTAALTRREVASVLGGANDVSGSQATSFTPTIGTVRSAGQPSGPVGHRDADILQYLSPRCLQKEEALLFGADWAAVTVAAFPHAPTGEVLRAAAQGFRDRNAVHSPERARHAHQRTAFRKKMLSETDGSVPYVYRPRVKRSEGEARPPERAAPEGVSGAGSRRHSPTALQHTPSQGVTSFLRSVEREASLGLHIPKPSVPVAANAAGTPLSELAPCTVAHITAISFPATDGRSEVGSPVGFPPLHKMSGTEIEDWNEAATEASSTATTPHQTSQLQTSEASRRSLVPALMSATMPVATGGRESLETAATLPNLVETVGQPSHMAQEDTRVCPASGPPTA